MRWRVLRVLVPDARLRLPFAWASVPAPFLIWGPIGPNIVALIDHTGKPRTDQDFRGKLLLIYFGYSYCPDVCPTDLQQIALAVDRLGSAGVAVRPLFITVDPERDTAAHLAEYVPLFHPRLIGLTGSAEQIGRTALAYKVYYAKFPPDSPDYVVDHSSFIYLVDETGKYIGFFPPGNVRRPHGGGNQTSASRFSIRALGPATDAS